MKNVLKVILTLAGIACIAVGAVLAFLPIPVGLLLIGLGLAILILGNERLRNWLTESRRRNPKLDKDLRKAEAKIPPPLSEPIRKTNPDKDE